MKIEFVEIQNFRKLRACRVELASQTTIFVGANNSGKTSAMDALVLFLKQGGHKSFETTDFTLSNWSNIDDLGNQWVHCPEDENLDLTINAWEPFLPSIDVWLRVDEKELHQVIELLPSLDWDPTMLLGVRLIFAPRDIEQLYRDFRESYLSARNTEKVSTNPESSLSLWPKSMREFLDRRLHNHFEIQSFVLDYTRCANPEQGVVNPQTLLPGSECITKNPFDGLIKMDEITAQRGFSDPKTEDDSHTSFSSLSTQLRRYFTKHLDPSEAPDKSDIDALEAIEAAKTVFDERLRTSFRSAIGELEHLNYPGFSDPQISITSKIDPRDSLDHESAVKFDLPGSDSLSLPENYNGLGYQNLISMVFSLIRFRDEWMRVGKAAMDEKTVDKVVEPLHLVLIEEPEAHLHAQVQQVFIKKAYDVLRNHDELSNSAFSTQMIVSTHSSHIAHELDFSCLRYFRREPATDKNEIPTATVINLSETFGNHDETSRFTTRYIRTTHCDLFFADAVVLVEGSAERMLIPHFIRTKFPRLDQSYISVLEIGGAHAHRLKPLLNTLGLLSLVITDIDSIGTTDRKKVQPARGEGYETGNTTLKNWVPNLKTLDELIELSDDAKQTSDGLVRVAYQCPIKVEYRTDSGAEEVIPYTFEDSLAMTNLALFRGFENPVGLLRKLKTALDKRTLKDASREMFEDLGKGSKAEMALELLYLSEPSEVMPPHYISTGLEWLEKKLDVRKLDVSSTESS